MKGISASVVFVSLCFLVLVTPDCIETEVNFDFNRALPQTQACSNPLPRTPDPLLGGPPLSIKFGALVEKDLMPILSKTVADAYMTAVDFLNRLSQNSGTNIQFSIEFENTRLNASYAAAKMKQLISRGANIILGPLTADEVLLVSPVADALGVTTVTATSTSIGFHSFNNLFRLVPSEEDHANTLAHILITNGIYSAVAVFRGDSFGIPFKDQFQRAYQNLGGNLTISLSYNPLNFNATILAADLESRVNEALSYISFGPKRFGVLMISLEEWQDIVQNIRSPLLLRQFWLGSSGVSSVRAPRPAVVEFARLAGGLSAAGIHIPQSIPQMSALSQFRARGYNSPDPVAYMSFDAVVMAGHTASLTRSTANPGFSTAFQALLKYLVGSSGRMYPNNIGERLTVRFTSETLDLVTGTWVPQAIFDPVLLTWSTNFNTFKKK